MWDVAPSAPKSVEAAAAELRATGVDAQALVCPARSGFPGQDLLAAAGATGADLIAMATHGQGGVARALLGSTAAETLRRAGAPVLLARPQTAARDAE